MTKVSVIMPIYNGEDYLKSSVESVLNQTYTDFELILVDDGSLDSTAEICDAYAASEKRVTVIHQKNAGSSSARIHGVSAAGGKYIAFIDADDWWDRDFIQSLLAEMETENCDLAACGCIQEYEDRQVYKRNNISCGRYIGRERMQLVHARMLHFDGFFSFGILPYMWNKLFKKDLLLKAFEQIDLKIRDGEDVALLMPYIAMAKGISILDVCPYHYRMHANQLTANKGKDFYENASRLYLNLKKRMEDKICYEVFLPQLDQYMRYMIWMGKPESFPKGKDYLFPYSKVPCKSKIILYAAGAVGKEYHSQLSRTNFCEVVAWVDQNKELYEAQDSIIENPEVILKKKFDYIVIAIDHADIYQKVKSWLVAQGISKEKII